MENYTRPSFIRAWYEKIVPETTRESVPWLKVLDTPVPGLEILDRAIGLSANSMGNTSRLNLSTLTDYALGHKAVSANKTPKPQNETLVGTIEFGKTTRFSLAGKDLVVDDGTWILGDLTPGKNAKVHGSIGSNGCLFATAILINQ